MEIYKIENLNFAYPESEKQVINNINLTINQGEFITLCGKSGSGKTTFLRLLKTCLSPNGTLSGKIYFGKKQLIDISFKEQAGKIGFVMQNPDSQIACDKVWHELAFGLESMGCSTPEIRARVAEMASFFGIEQWFHKKTNSLSGGQKQLLNLASIMIMQPDVIILDEPTSQLDPIAASEFLNTLKKINREFGTTVILSEHRLEEAIPLSDRVLVIDNGEIIADALPQETGKILKDKNHPMQLSLPTPMKVYLELENGGNCPVTIRDGKQWLENYSKNHEVKNNVCPKGIITPLYEEKIIEIKDIYFRYDKNLPDVIKGLNLTVNKGQICAIVGGNGTGKTTLLSLVSGINTFYRGDILIKGKSILKHKDLYNGIIGVLPQNPQTLFLKSTVKLDLFEVLQEKNLSREEQEKLIEKVINICRLNDVTDRHPYDLSGGEMQRAALAKVLLLSPEILLLDEPTKGFDGEFKQIFAEILKSLKAMGKTIVMVSHDIEFCAEVADSCALVFDGEIVSQGTPYEFFSGKTFYTTSANKMARNILPEAVLAQDIILAFGGEIREKKIPLPEEKIHNEIPAEISSVQKKKSIFKVITGIVSALLFLIITLSFITDIDILNLSALSFISPLGLQALSLGLITLSFVLLMPKKNKSTEMSVLKEDNKKVSKPLLFATCFMLIAVPLTIFAGIHLFDDRKYYFISLLIILETLFPFLLAFEWGKAKTRKLIIISVLCALAVGGRAVFYTLPQFKPLIAIVIISGICFGGETGFLVGAVSGFVSNFFFGQGPWTPWQMFALGLIGFMAGILFAKIKVSKISVTIFGILATIIIYGGITNPQMLFMMQEEITFEMLLITYMSGLPFDILHALSTAFFLYFITEPMTDKINRIKTKYRL